MDRINDIKLLAQKYSTSFIGYGNPDSDVLIIGNECAFTPETTWDREKKFNQITYYDNAKSWLKYVEKPIDSSEIPDWKDTMEWDWENHFSPRFAFKGQFYSVAKWAYGATSPVWFTYQKLIDAYRRVTRSSGLFDVWEGDYLKEPDSLDFQDHCFITEFSDVPMEKSNPSHKTEASVVSRINTLFKEAFFQSFPIVVISSRAYVKLYNIDLERLFPNSKVIVANLLSRTPSAKYLEGIVAKMKGENNYCYPYKELRFTDPYGKTSLSSLKTLLFCAYLHFSIPHDVVGAILYGMVLAGSSKASFGHDTQCVSDLSPFVCVECADWCLPAIESMGYPDIVEEFKHLDDEMVRFLEENYLDKPWDIDIIRKKIESIVPQQYMTIIKNNQ